MRIISGQLSGRNFSPVAGHRTHPMSEKIRGALFNALGDISGLSVFDPYAGTGALGFESISRGASSVQMIDLDKNAARTITENIELLGLGEQASVTKAAATAWSKRHPNHTYDIVMLDPPYNAVEPKELLQLAKHVKPGGILVLSLPPENGFRYGQSRMELLQEKNYGDAELSFYRAISR